MIQIHITDNPVDAYIIKGLLEAKGITVSVRNEDMIGEYPSIWVSEDAPFESTKKVISAYLCGRVETLSEEWCCSGCGEQIEIQFYECWKCGTSQPTWG